MDLKEIIQKVKKEAEKYEDAPMVESLARELIEKYELHDAKEAHVKYLFYKADESSYLGKCSRATGKWSYLTGYDYVIEIWKPFWDSATDQARRAVVYHELLHIQKKVTKKGKVRWLIRKHDVEEFLEVVQEFGPWSTMMQELKRLINENIPSESRGD